MGEECGTLEGKGEEFELSLELSIGGGKYGKSENSRGRNENLVISRSAFSCDVPADLQRRKEIQALRRLEARKKREMKLKKSRKVGGKNDNNNKLLFEAQKFRTRVEDRGNREINVSSGGENRKRETNGDELSLSLFTENKNKEMEIGKCLLYPKVQALNFGFGYPINNPCEASYWGGEGETFSNRSLEQSSSAVSDYQSTSHKGGSSSDTGSHSSASRLRQHGSISTNGFDHHFESNDSSCQTEPGSRIGGGPTKSAQSSRPHLSWAQFSERPKVPETHFDQMNNTTSAPKQTNGGLNEKPVGPQNASSTVHMPCVSTTGNGPNGKTVRGFLYKYTKTEVSIVCVCHGNSFSPAEFVEHAGGVDISHPLRHITIVRSPLG